MNLTCKYCKNPISDTFYFCPNCGKKLKEPPFKFSLGKALLIILESILLPPLGLIPGIKYFLKDDRRAQVLGIIAIGLTITSLILGIIFTINLFKGTLSAVNQINQTQGLISNPQGSPQDQINQTPAISLVLKP